MRIVIEQRFLIGIGFVAQGHESIKRRIALVYPVVAAVGYEFPPRYIPDGSKVRDDFQLLFAAEIVADVVIEQLPRALPGGILDQQGDGNTGTAT